MTIVSVCHRRSILKYHQQALQLVGNKEWRVYPTDEDCFDS